MKDVFFGKQKNVSFSKIERVPKDKNSELTHANLWGLSIVTSLKGSNYYTTFIDDSSRKVWVQFLKNKYDIFALERLKVMVENKTNLKVKYLQSNNGGEYVDDDFKKYYIDNGIKIKNIPRIPQKKKNSVAKRMRTLK